MDGAGSTLVVILPCLQGLRINHHLAHDFDLYRIKRLIIYCLQLHPTETVLDSYIALFFKAIKCHTLTGVSPLWVLIIVGGVVKITGFSFRQASRVILWLSCISLRALQ